MHFHQTNEVPCKKIGVSQANSHPEKILEKIREPNNKKSLALGVMEKQDYRKTFDSPFNLALNIVNMMRLFYCFLPECQVQVQGVWTHPCLQPNLPKFHKILPI
jgi:hypothetical protein